MNGKDATINIITITGLFILCIISLLKLNNKEWYYGLILGILVVVIMIIYLIFWQRTHFINILTDIIKERCNKNLPEIELKKEIEELRDRISTLIIKNDEYAKKIDELKKAHQQISVSDMIKKSSH